MLAPLRAWVDDPKVTPTMIKGFVVTVIALAIIIPLALIAVPYIPFFNDLAVQPKGKSQMAWQRADGKTVPVVRQPVARTIPRGHYPYPLGSASAERAAKLLAGDSAALAPPYRAPKPTRPMMRRGKELFERYCVVCHGDSASGDGPVTAKGFPAPPSLLRRAAQGFTAGRIFHVITMGQKTMPPYADKLDPEMRWAVSYYLRALQLANPPPAAPAKSPAATPAKSSPGSGGSTP